MTEREEHDKLAGELEREADRLAQESQRVGKDIAQTRDDWEAKRRDDSVPGANPHPAESDRDAPGDDVNPEDAGR